MRLALILAFFAVLLPAAAEDEPQVTHYTLEEWHEWRDKLKGFDEIRMTLAEKWVPHPIGHKKDGSIEFTEKRLRDTLLHEQSEIADADSLLGQLEFESNVPKLAHGCLGLFNLTFYKEGQLVGRLHYAHGEYWQPLTAKSQAAVSRWLIGHGFPIEETKKLDKKEASQAPQITPLKRRG